MDKSKIEEVRYNREKCSLYVKFKDGSMYGETGKTAIRTMAQLVDENVNVIEINDNNLKH